jgi:pyruvate/2-oxoglutarate dehydrogenase complex dihydrolipoamide dehydrogenase (E3) component
MSDTPPLEPWDEPNRRLYGHVHPPDWVNPSPVPRYNLLVIGGGTAGLVAAAGAAGLGARVALIERHLLGGDCLNVGCVPSKALIRAARAAAEARDCARFGVTIRGDVTVDFPAVMERMRRLRADLSPHDSAARFRELGVDVFIGDARFTGHDSVEVGGQNLHFSKAAIATGARASAPAIPGINDVPYLTNETLFSLTELPRRLAIIGAGPIGCEMAQTFARFGAEVSLIESTAGILPREDREAAEILRAALVRDGVKILCDGKDLKLSRLQGTEGVRWQLNAGGNEHAGNADRLLVAVGRAPNIEGLGLETAGVAFDKTGVTVNDFLQTTNPRIYACGDICSRFKFTHAADFMARLVIQNALFKGRRRASALTIPWCTYTSPEVAHVGLTDVDAKAQGVGIDTFTQPLAKVDRAILDGEDEGFVRVHVRRGTDKILGATIVAAHAGDMIGELSLAMTNRIGLRGIGAAIHPYPTQAEAIRKVGDLYSRTRLTPFVKRVFGKWLAWQRT